MDVDSIPAVFECMYPSVPILLGCFPDDTTLETNDNMLKVLFWFSCHRDYFRFRVSELTSIAASLGISSDILWKGKETQNNNRTFSSIKELRYQNILESVDKGSETMITFGTDSDVFLFGYLPKVEYEVLAEQMISRSVLLKGIVKIWAHGNNYSIVQEKIKEMDIKLLNTYINREKSFFFLVNSFGRHITQEEQKDRMNKFSFLFSGKEKANLDNPDTTLVIFEKWEKTENIMEPELKHVYFGRAIALRPKGAPWWWPYRLTVRSVLGPTTMDNELAFIIANQGQVCPGKIVLDPFCGTGGILIAASHFGGFCYGADIDSRVLKGWGIAQRNKNVSHPPNATSDIFRNFKEYKLNTPEILRMDTAAWTRHTAAHTNDATKNNFCKPWVDIILTDPPYGIRASVREVSGASQSFQTTHDDDKINCQINPLEIVNNQSSNYIPPTKVSTVDAIINDLLFLASTLLVNNGLLVFLLPVDLLRVKEDVARVYHPDLRLESAGLQGLTGGVGRVLMTMRRVIRKTGV